MRIIPLKYFTVYLSFISKAVFQDKGRVYIGRDKENSKKDAILLLVQ